MTAAHVPPDLLHRLRSEASACEERIRHTLMAHRTGELDTGAVMRACGMELHSIKGAASVLGMLDTFRIVGGIGEKMMKVSVEPDEQFWTSFETWLGLLTRHIASHDRPQRSHMAATLEDKRAELEQVLGQAPSLQVVLSKRPERAQGLTPSAGRRLLVIEDSATVRAALSARLGQQGYPIECAEDLMSVAEKLRDFDPEIVICDVNMPGVEGDEVCRRIKAYMHRLVPVILYSSLDREELAERARRARADGYVCKGDGIEALMHCMDDLLSEEILF